jgi:hypothetical protein
MASDSVFALRILNLFRNSVFGFRISCSSALPAPLWSRRLREAAGAPKHVRSCLVTPELLALTELAILELPLLPRMLRLKGLAFRFLPLL